MKGIVALGCLLLVAGLDPRCTVAGQDSRLDELAKRVVTTSTNVKPGDVVVVAGGRHTIPLMESLAIEAQKAGGMSVMFLDTDRVTRAFYTEVPEKYLEQEPRFFAEWLKHIQVWIAADYDEDPKSLYAGVPEERRAKVARASRFVQEALNNSGIRLVYILYPTRAQAAAYQVDFALYEKMHWGAVNADYRQISEQGGRLKTVLERAKSVHVTTPSGTDLRFSLANRPVFLEDGIVTEEEAKGKLFLNRTAQLPGGGVAVAPLETSGTGKVVVPRDQCRYEPLTGVSFELNNGRMEHFKAEKGGPCLQERMAAYTGPKDLLGFFTIGLNPAARVLEDPGDYRPSYAAGMVYIGLGNNQLLGGNNKDPGSFRFPLLRATVTVDGKVVVKDGQIVR